MFKFKNVLPPILTRFTDLLYWMRQSVTDQGIKRQFSMQRIHRRRPRGVTSTDFWKENEKLICPGRKKCCSKGDLSLSILLVVLLILALNLPHLRSSGSLQGPAASRGSDCIEGFWKAKTILAWEKQSHILDCLCKGHSQVPTWINLAQLSKYKYMEMKSKYRLILSLPSQGIAMQRFYFGKEKIFLKESTILNCLKLLEPT